MTRHFRDSRARHVAPVLVGGWAMDNMLVEFNTSDKVGLDKLWNDVEMTWKYLRRDERILLQLMREDRTPTDIAEVLNLGERWVAQDEMQRCIQVVKFYVVHSEALSELSKWLDADGTNTKYARVIKLYVLRRMGKRAVSEKIGVSLNMADTAMRWAIRNATGKIAEMLKECYALAVLRKNRRVGMDELWRARLKTLILMNIGKVWYSWGKQDPFGKTHSADCSGLVIEALKDVNVLPDGFRDITAQGLAKYFRKTVLKPKVGDLAFYGRSPRGIAHVMFCMGKLQLDDKIFNNVVSGMCGGRKGMAVNYAMTVGAALWVRTSAKYRRDFLFYRRVQ